MTTLLKLNLSLEEQFLVGVLVHRNFLDCAKIKRIYEQIGDAKLFAICEHNKITSIGADALRKCIGENIPRHWIEAYNVMDSRIKSYMAELDRAAILLAKHDISLLALKNSGITRGLYQFDGACPMGDLDVLVSKADFRKAHEVLSNHGYQMKFRSPLEEESLDKAEQGGGAEYKVKLPNGDFLWFELQWRPVAGRWITPEQEPKAEDLVNRSISIPGSSVRLLSPEDNLLQVSLHTAKHSYVRAPGFRLHTDVDRIVRSSDIDWTLFIARVKSLKVKTAVFFSLVLAKEMLDTPVPNEVIEQLAPKPWKVKLMSGWLQKVGLFDPDEKKWGRFGYVIFVALLYDSLSLLLGSVIPKRESIESKYNVRSPILLPYYYVLRLVNVLTKHTLN